VGTAIDWELCPFTVVVGDLADGLQVGEILGIKPHFDFEANKTYSLLMLLETEWIEWPSVRI
jgi:hypothetical protein